MLERIEREWADDEETKIIQAKLQEDKLIECEGMPGEPSPTRVRRSRPGSRAHTRAEHSAYKRSTVFFFSEFMW